MMSRALVGDHAPGEARLKEHWLASAGTWIVALLAVALLLRLLAMYAIVLVPEEAYYWTYAQHPSLSYYDHPPMVAWVIAAGTRLFGHCEFGVRIVGNLLMLASVGLLYLHGRIWYGRAAAMLGAMCVLVLPVYFGTGFIATMDAPLVFFFSAGLLGVSAAVKQGRSAGWYFAGAALGGALLSKYTGVFLAVGAVLSVIAVPRFRRHLLSPHPYLGVLLALAIFAPVLIWNARHDWASFRFQFVDRFAEKEMGWENPLQFLGMQLAVATPILLVATILLSVRLVRAAIAARGRRRTLPARAWIALCFSAPLLAVMAYKSIGYDIHINWTLPAYLSLMPATAHAVLAHARRARASHGRVKPRQDVQWTACACLAVNIALMVYLLAGQSLLHMPSALGPWRELAAVIEDFEDRMEEKSGREPLIVADGKYRLASVLAFYRTSIEDRVPAAKFTSSQWLLEGEGLGFEYWQRPGDWLGGDCIVVDDDQGLWKIIKGRFDRIEPVDDPRLKALGFEAALCYGYRGPKPLVAADSAARIASAASTAP